jgi:hypothetical protein
MPYLHDSIELEKHKFIQLLDSTFDTVEIDNAEQIDDIVASQVCGIMCSNIGHIVNRARSNPDQTSFLVRSQAFDIILSKGAFLRAKYDSSVFRILLAPHLSLDSNQHDLVEITHPISRPGRFSQLSLMFPPDSLTPNSEYVFALLDAIFGVAHQWLRVKLTRSLDRLVGDSTKELYDYIYITLPSQDFARGLMIGIFLKDPQTGRYVDVSIPNTTATGYFVDLAEQRARLLTRSPVTLALQAIGEIIDQDESAVRLAVERQRAVSVNPLSTKFYSQTAGFRDTLFAVWPEGFTILPLANEGDVFLTAIFPTNNRSYLNDYFRIHGKAVVDIATKRVSFMNRALRKLRKIGRGATAEGFGTFFGSAAAALFKHLTH